MHPFALFAGNETNRSVARSGCIQPPPAMAATAYDKEQVYESL
jgi:hypothetical protein